jgi:NADPH:quinone reductase-like Zn-dependent oxidoreductase
VTVAGRVSADHLKEISELIEAKQLRRVVGVVFPLGQEAQALSQSRHEHGRIILQID